MNPDIIFLYIYIYIYIYLEVNNRKEFDSMEKNWKQNNPKLMNLLGGKSTLKRFGFNEPSSGL